MASVNGKKFIVRFSMPMLPKEWYLKLVELQGGLSFAPGNQGQWQTIIFALMAACELGKVNPEVAMLLAKEVKEKYPPVKYDNPYKINK